MESKYKILVVDDDEKILDLIEDILLTSNFSFEIKKAKSEVEAYEAIKKSQFDIAIIDLKLGEKGDEGIDLTKKIKSVSPKTLAIIMTAYPSLETAIYALRLESHDYLIKPFTPEQLINSISQAIRKIKMREKEEVRLINNSNFNDFGEIIFASEKMKK
jgi:DNA-binding NtrC family response regulator